MSLIESVKRKKEFSMLPDSIVERALKESGEDVKEARKLLRKYFGVFLTNRVLKGRGDLLGIHISSKKRDYEDFYFRIFEGMDKIRSVVDLGCGVNGFSYEYLRDVIGDVDYIGVEAAGQLVELMNKYFEENEFSAWAIKGDLFDIDGVVKILEKSAKPRVVFLFQVVDALESMERNFSKKFILKVMEGCEWMVISLPLVSLGGRKKFEVSRRWLVDFLEEEFIVEKDFEMFGERILIFRR
ncbi:hypothetical protein KAT36_00745 [Candidatus Pacearchaeota archaeon]|nr:hypothetical protein [Candidatus Pacearchaeota archaeon]